MKHMQKQKHNLKELKHICQVTQDTNTNTDENTNTNTDVNTNKNTNTGVDTKF